MKARRGLADAPTASEALHGFFMKVPILYSCCWCCKRIYGITRSGSNDKQNADFFLRNCSRMHAAPRVGRRSMRSGIFYCPLRFVRIVAGRLRFVEIARCSRTQRSGLPPYLVQYHEFFGSEIIGYFIKRDLFAKQFTFGKIGYGFAVLQVVGGVYLPVAQ